MRQFLFFSALLLFSCGEQAEPRADSDSIKPVATHVPPGNVAGWEGTYEVDSTFGEDPAGAAILIGYTLSVQPDSVIFTGMGYQTWFRYLCTARPAGDTLLLFFSKTLDGGFVSYEKLSPLARLFREGDRFYIQSEALAFGEKDGVEIKLKIED